MNETITHKGRFDGSKEAFADFCAQFKLFQGIEIRIDREHEDSIWYSFKGGAAHGIQAGKEQAFYERRDADLAYFETLRDIIKRRI